MTDQLLLDELLEKKMLVLEADDNLPPVDPDEDEDDEDDSDEDDDEDGGDGDEEDDKDAPEI